jgi:hypothetical protein
MCQSYKSFVSDIELDRDDVRNLLRSEISEFRLYMLANFG